jgi:hypothetical protein
MRRDETAASTEVTIQLDRVNPVFKTIVIKKVVLINNGDEKTAFRFTLDKEGKVIEVNELPMKLAGKGDIPL